MTATQGMAGDYDEHSQYQRAVADTGTARITDSVAAIAASAGSPFVVADYGAATGANSMAAMRTAIVAVRARNADQPVVALHNDLPSNDWNQLFTNLESSPDSYQHLPPPPVIPLVSAVSFFQPAAPSRSVHVGMSFSAAHWLREQPNVALPEGFYFCEATGDAAAALARAAAADWATFLAARAHDLAPGGRLLVQFVGTEVAADGTRHVTARALLQAMAEVAWRMAADGLLRADAVRDYVLAVYARTVDEARAPYAAAGSPLHDAFTEVECRTDRVANPYFTKWQQDGDAEAYARSYVAFVRGFTESSLRDHLFTPGAIDGNVDGALDEFFDRLRARFAADPTRDKFDDWTLTVLLSRR
jgi:cyclopropane-fatty-acyl-phospholipid synthase